MESSGHPATTDEMICTSQVVWRVRPQNGFKPDLSCTSTHHESESAEGEARNVTAEPDDLSVGLL